LTLSFGASACSSGGPLKLDNPFPTEQEITALAASPAPKIDESIVRVSNAPVAEWTLTGPFPKMIGSLPRTPTNAFERYLDEHAAKSKRVEHTEAMHCAAREFGLFVLATDQQADDRLERFILNRCGAIGLRLVGLPYFTIESPGDPDVEKVLEGTRKGFDDFLSKASKFKPAVEIGGWVHGNGEKQIVVLAVALTNVEIEPVPIIPTKRNEVTLKGRYLARGYTVTGAVTRGEYGAESCVDDTRVKFPAFVVTCELSPKDDTSRVVLAVAEKKNSFFVSRVFSQEFSPSGNPPTAYAQDGTMTIIGETPLTNEGQELASLPEQMLTLINAVREEAGIAPMTLDTAQTRLIMSVAPHLYNAFMNDADRANEIVYGLLAGWSVKENLVNATFADEGYAKPDARELVRKMLEDPGGRNTLLDKTSTILAVGGVELQNGKTRVSAFSYEPLPDETHSRRVFRVRQRINKTRKLNGLKKIKWYKPFESDAAKIAARMEAGELSPEKGTERFAQEVIEGLQQGVRYYTTVTSDLEDFYVFEQMVAEKDAKAAIMVAALRPEGYPWTIYYIVVVMPDSGSSAQMASR